MLSFLLGGQTQQNTITHERQTRTPVAVTFCHINTISVLFHIALTLQKRKLSLAPFGSICFRLNFSAGHFSHVRLNFTCLSKKGQIRKNKWSVWVEISPSRKKLHPSFPFKWHIGSLVTEIRLQTNFSLEETGRVLCWVSGHEYTALNLWFSFTWVLSFHAFGCWIYESRILIGIYSFGKTEIPVAMLSVCNDSHQEFHFGITTCSYS